MLKPSQPNPSKSGSSSMWDAVTGGIEYSKGFIEVHQGTLNRKMKLTDTGLFFSRTSDGGYSQSITGNGGSSLLVNARSTIALVTNAAWRLYISETTITSNLRTIFNDVINVGSVNNQDNSKTGFSIDLSGEMRVWEGLRINRASSTLEEFQVSGTSLLQGNGSTSATNSLVIKDSIGNTHLTFRDDGRMYLGPNSYLDVSGNGNLIGNVGIGAGSIDASAQLDVSSTTKGFLKPRMTTVQKNAIGIPATGLSVFDTDLNRPEYYDGSAWQSGTGFWSSMTGGISYTNKAMVGSGIVAPQAKFTIISDGSTAISKAFRIYNSTLTQTFEVDDSGRTTIGRALVNVTNCQYYNNYNDSKTVFSTAAGSSNLNVWLGLVVGGNLSTALDASAIVEFNSTTKGFLLPRMDKTQRLAIASPANALMVYQTDAFQGIYVYDNVVGEYNYIAKQAFGELNCVTGPAQSITGTYAKVNTLNTQGLYHGVIPATATNRLVAGVTGVFTVKVSGSFAFTLANTELTFALYVNGTISSLTALAIHSQGANEKVPLNLEKTLELTENDHVELYVKTASNGDFTLQLGTVFNAASHKLTNA